MFSVSTGAVGAVVSKVNPSAAEAALALPVASVTVAVRLFTPSAPKLLVTTFAAPALASAALSTLLPTTAPVPSNSLTTAPVAVTSLAVKLTRTEGVVTLVRPSPFTPLSDTVFSVSTGAVGAARSSCNVMPLPLPLRFPAASLRVEVIALEPSTPKSIVVKVTLPAAISVLLRVMLATSTPAD